MTSNQRVNFLEGRGPRGGVAKSCRLVVSNARRTNNGRVTVSPPNFNGALQ